MKKLLVLIGAIVLFASCEKEPINIINKYRVEMEVKQNAPQPKLYSIDIQEGENYLVSKVLSDTIFFHEWSREGKKPIHIGFSGKPSIIAKIKLYKNGDVVAYKESTQENYNIYMSGEY